MPKSKADTSETPASALDAAGDLVAAFQRTLPEGSRVVFDGVHWNVTHGAGSARHGVGRSISVANLRVGATQTLENGVMVERTGSGDVIPPEDQDAADQRADDQDAAMEAALLAGTLPDHDRRTT
jgi:hypothetical protein